MAAIRVLVVDDSAFMRKFISDIINNEHDMKVVGSARNGQIALDKIRELNPDVVTLDVEMPGKNGLEVLSEIQGTVNTQVIMLSGLTSEGSAITLEALEKGAFDFIQKPSGLNFKTEDLKTELIQKIRYAAACKEKSSKTKTIPIEKREQRKKLPTVKKITAVAIGASTGGPRVLFDIVTRFPPEFNVPIFIVQHMPAGFTKAFAERLNSKSPLNVVEAKNNDEILPGNVYVAPGGFHMTVDRNKILLDKTPPLHGVRPAVDKLFTTASNVYRDGLLCCVCTGMGRDGADGVKAVKANGGFVLAQDEETSVINGMPKAAYDTGCVDAVLPDYKIADEITKMVMSCK